MIYFKLGCTLLKMMIILKTFGLIVVICGFVFGSKYFFYVFRGITYHVVDVKVGQVTMVLSYSCYIT